jgi:hypothetical protein
MLALMQRTRLAAAALLGLGVALLGACESREQNGQQCLKNDDCESSRCVAYVCVDPASSQPPYDGGTTADTSTTDSGSTETAADSAPADSTPADSTSTDSAMDSGTADTAAD